MKDRVAGDDQGLLRAKEDVARPRRDPSSGARCGTSSPSWSEPVTTQAPSPRCGLF